MSLLVAESGSRLVRGLTLPGSSSLPIPCTTRWKDSKTSGDPGKIIRRYSATVSDCSSGIGRSYLATCQSSGLSQSDDSLTLPAFGYEFLAVDCSYVPVRNALYRQVSEMMVVGKEPVIGSHRADTRVF